MGNKKIKTLPQLPPDIQARLEALSEEVRIIWASMDFGPTKKAVRIGHKLLSGEVAVYAIFGQKRNVWSQFRSYYFPEIETARMAERYMFLARHIDLDDPTILFYLSQASLTDLIHRAGKQGIQNFLVANGIDIDWGMDPKKKKNKPMVACFKKAVLDLIASLKKEEVKGNSERDHVEKDPKHSEPARHPIITEAINNLEESFDQVQQLLTSITGRKDFKGQKRRRLRVKLIKYRRILNLFIESTSEKHERSEQLLSSRAQKKGGGLLVLKRRPSGLRDI
jgi:hypothetical protein